MYTRADRRTVVRLCRSGVAMSRRRRQRQRRQSINQRQTVVARDLCRRTWRLCVCSRPRRSIFLRFRRRMHESAVHTTTAETAAYSGRLTAGSFRPIFTHEINDYVYTCKKISLSDHHTAIISIHGQDRIGIFHSGGDKNIKYLINDFCDELNFYAKKCLILLRLWPRYFLNHIIMTDSGRKITFDV